MTKPTEKPTFATDATYAISDKPWSETATKVQPVAALVASGFEPKRRPPAQYFNWLFGNIGDWIDWLDTSVFADIAGVVANIDGLDPDGSGELGNIGIVRLEMAGRHALRSMIDGEHGRRVLIMNNFNPDPNPITGDGSQVFTVLHRDGAATEKQFFLPRPDYEANADDGGEGVSEIMIEPGGCMLVQKDDGRDAWVVIATCGARKRIGWSVNIAGNAYSSPTDDIYLRKDDGSLQLDATSNVVFVPFQPEVGSIITGDFRLVVMKQTDASGDPILADVGVGSAGGVAYLSQASNDDNAPGFPTVMEIDTETDRVPVLRDMSFWLRVQPTGGDTPGPDLLFYLTVYGWSPVQP
jgi:hypothetical protein